MSAVSSEIPTTSGAFRPVNVVTKPGTVAHVVMPAASTMRGVTGFRMFDAVNGALAQLIPHRVPAAGEGGNSLAIFAGEGSGRRAVHLLRARRRHVGRAADRGRERRPLQPGRDGREHPRRGGRVRVPDQDRALRARPRQRRRRAASAAASRSSARGGRSCRTRRCRCAPTGRTTRRTGCTAGCPGGFSANERHERQRRRRRYPPMFSTTIGSGAVYHHRMAGGGGWGDPLDRDPAAVADDVRNEKVGAASARERLRASCCATDGVGRRRRDRGAARVEAGA